MFCPNCGNEIYEQSAFCPFCGASVAQAQAPVQPTAPVLEPVADTVPVPAPEPAPAPVTMPEPEPVNFTPPTPIYTGFDVMKRTFSSGLFLTFCIIISVSALTFSLYSILGTIAAWIIYANAKSKTEPMKQGGYKFAAVITRIAFIMNWIAVGAAALGALVLGGIMSFAGNIFVDGMTPEMFEEFSDDFSDIYGTMPNSSLNYFLQYLFPALGIVVVIVAVIAIAYIIIYNLCLIRPLDKYTHGLSNAFVTGNAVVYNKSVSTRILVFAIITAVFTLPGLLSASVMAIAVSPLSVIGSIASLAVPFFAFAVIRSAKN